MSKFTVLCLNCCSGLRYEALMQAMKSWKQSIDVFCLQEVNSYQGTDFVEYEDERGKPPIRANLLEELTAEMSDYKVFYGPQVLDDHNVPGVRFGLVAMVRNGLDLVEVEEDFFRQQLEKFKGHGDHGRNIQSLRFADGLTVYNLHGTWDASGKGDTEERLLQSERILDVLKRHEGPQVVTGDFNLLPETKSIAAFEAAGYRNLIKEYGVTSTRSRHYPKYDTHPLYADYVFVNPAVTIERFEVLPNEVSDHLPLLLEFSY